MMRIMNVISYFKLSSLLLVLLPAILRYVSSDVKYESCDHPGIPINGDIDPDKDRYFTDESVRFNCSPGLTLIGAANIKCNGDNSWSSKVPHCGINAALGSEIECLEEDWKYFNITDGMSQLTDGNIHSYNTLNINKSIKLTTSFQRKYNITLVKLYAKEIHKELNVRVKFMKEKDETICESYDTTTDSVIKIKMFSCKPDFKVDPIETFQLIFTSPFEFNLTLCEIAAISTLERRCGTPDIKPFCKVNFTFNEAHYFPMHNHDMEGETIRVCHQAKWSKKAPKCEDVVTSCGTPEIPINGYLSHTKENYRDGDKVKLLCNEHFLLYGPETIECTNNGIFSWDSHQRYCDKNLMFQRNFTIAKKIVKMTHCLQNSTDGNFSSMSTLKLNKHRSLYINFKRIYTIEQLRLKMNFDNDPRTSESNDNFIVIIKFNNQSLGQQSQFCKKLHFNAVTLRTNSLIVFYCDKNPSTGDTISFDFNGSTQIKINLWEIEVLTFQLHPSFINRCHIRKRSPNCLTQTMFDLHGTQYLLYFPQQDHYIRGQTLLSCLKGKWEGSPPFCLPYINQTNQSRSNEFEDESLNCGKNCSHCLSEYESNKYNQCSNGCEDKIIIVVVVCFLVSVGIVVFFICFIRRKKRNEQRKVNKREVTALRNEISEQFELSAEEPNPIFFHSVNRDTQEYDDVLCDRLTETDKDDYLIPRKTICEEDHFYAEVDYDIVDKKHMQSNENSNDDELYLEMK